MRCYFFFVVLPLGPSCSERDAISLYFMCCSVNVSVCIVCCVFYSAGELFGETIRNMFECWLLFCC